MPHLPLKLDTKYQPHFLTSGKTLVEPITKRMARRGEKMKLLYPPIVNYLSQEKNGMIEISYPRKKNNIGRSFISKGKIGLTNVKRPFRNTLINDEMIDFDLKNAQPSLALNICLNNQIPCNNLKHLVEHRDELLEELMTDFSITKKVAKELIQKTMFGGTIEYWMEENGLSPEIPVNEFWDNFRREINEITEKIKEENPTIIKTLSSDDKSNDASNENGRFLANYLQHCEFIVVDRAMRFVALQGGFEYQLVIKKGKKRSVKTIQAGTYEFDGFKLMKKSVSNPDQLLDDLNTHIRSIFGSYITFDLKPLDDIQDLGIFEDEAIDDEEEDPESQERVFEEGVENDEEATMKFYELNKDYLRNSGGNIWVFDQDDGLWKNTKQALRKSIISKKDNLHLLETKADGSVMKSKRSYGTAVTLMDKIITLLDSVIPETNWLKDKDTSSLGYWLFDNGYLDLDTKIFHPKEEGFNPELVFFAKIPREFDPTPITEVDLTGEKSLFKRLFSDPLGEETAKFALVYYARALAGKKDKSLLFNLGATNAGKSLIAKIFRKVFGPQMVGIFNAENFVFRNSNGDEARDNRWALMMKHNRLLFSNEIKMGQDLDGNLLKKHSAGLDELVGRTHGGEETDFFPHYGIAIGGNDLPRIIPLEDGDRYKVINYTKSFVETPTTPFELKKDPNLETEIDTEEFQNNFIRLILYALWNFPTTEPEVLKENKREWIGNEEGSNSGIDLFLNDFDITGNQEDAVSVADTSRWLEVKNIGMSSRKLLQEVKKKANLTGLVVNTGQKKVGGKNCRCWCGVKLKLVIDTTIEEPSPPIQKSPPIQTPPPPVAPNPKPKPIQKVKEEPIQMTITLTTGEVRPLQTR